MTSRNRLMAVVAVILCAIAAAAAYALLAGGKSSPASAKPSTAKSSTAKSSSETARPGTTAKPSAPARPSASSSWVPTNSAIADVCRSKLPSQALDTLVLIDKGGPYPYRSDGIVFENRESRLPRQATGYYHEFTVVTPGSGDRGTRRVVTGTAGEEYWTGDHYSSFQEIDGRC